LKLLLLFNPAAGRGRARRHVEEAKEHLRSLGARVETAASKSPDDLTRLAAEGSRGDFDRVVVCGGDGTLHRAVRDFDLAGAPLALLPLGSGDDFAKVCGISRNLRAACEVAVRGAIREVDVAHANGIRYLGVAGLGFDSEVNEYANSIRLPLGSFVYVYATLRLLPRFQPHNVSIDGAPAAPIMFAAVGNARQYGGGIRIAPDAQLDDGLLDACIVHRTSRFQLLMTMPRAYSGAHTKSEFVELRRAAAFLFESEEALKVYGDGEYMTTTPVRFGVEGRRLRVVTG